MGLSPLVMRMRLWWHFHLRRAVHLGRLGCRLNCNGPEIAACMLNDSLLNRASLF